MQFIPNLTGDFVPFVLLFSLLYSFFLPLICLFILMQKAGDHGNGSLGVALLKARSLFPQSYWYWIGIGALLGYTVLFNLLFTIFLTYLNRKPSCFKWFLDHSLFRSNNCKTSSMNTLFLCFILSKIF